MKTLLAWECLTLACVSLIFVLTWKLSGEPQKGTLARGPAVIVDGAFDQIIDETTRLKANRISTAPTPVVNLDRFDDKTKSVFRDCIDVYEWGHCIEIIENAHNDR